MIGFFLLSRVTVTIKKNIFGWQYVFWFGYFVGVSLYLSYIYKEHIVGKSQVCVKQIVIDQRHLWKVHK